MARGEITYSGAGSYTAFLLDEQNRELVRIHGASLKEVLALLAERYPGLPVRVVPLRNPAVRIEWTGAGAGRYLAVVVDERNHVVEEFLGTLPEVEAWMRREWPELPAAFVPMIRNPRSREHYGSVGRAAAPPF